MPDACRGQKRASGLLELLELELELTVSLHMGTFLPLKEQSVLLTAEPSLQALDSRVLQA